MIVEEFESSFWLDEYEPLSFRTPADLPPEVLCRAVNAMFAVIVEYYDSVPPDQLTPQHIQWLESVRKEETPEMYQEVYDWYKEARLCEPITGELIEK